MIAADVTAYGAVFVCSCGWRVGAPTRAAGWRLAADHERDAHPGTLQAAQRLAQTTRRNASVTEKMPDSGS